MSKLLVPDPAIGWHMPEAQEDATPLPVLCLHLIQIWIGRHRQRKALAELAETNGHLLQDIGLSQEAALREAEKPFWRD